MPKFNKDIGTRISTGLMFIGAILIGTLFSVYGVWILFGLINLCTIVEYQGLVSKLPGNHPRDLVYERVFNAIMATLVYLLLTAVVFQWLNVKFLILLLPLLLVFFIKSLFSSSETPLSGLSYNLMGIVWITFSSAVFVPLSIVDGDFNPYKLIGFIFIVWASDSFAYLIGSLFGKTPLFPRISPKKTWEGTLGGFAGSILFAFIFSLLIPDWSFIKWAMVATMASSLGTIGDLIESQLKRTAKVKDSGTIFPGHGGFLDRFDALLFSAPFVFSFVYLY